MSGSLKLSQLSQKCLVRCSVPYLLTPTMTVRTGDTRKHTHSDVTKVWPAATWCLGFLNPELQDCLTNSIGGFWRPHPALPHDLNVQVCIHQQRFGSQALGTTTRACWCSGLQTSRGPWTRPSGGGKWKVLEGSGCSVLVLTAPSLIGQI